MNSTDIAKYAALVAAGVVTEDMLADIVGDDTIVQEIITAAGAGAIVGAASGIIEDVVDTGADIIDTINPFSW